MIKSRIETSAGLTELSGTELDLCSPLIAPRLARPAHGGLCLLPLWAYRRPNECPPLWQSSNSLNT
jgi:hypothetical protein